MSYAIVIERNAARALARIPNPDYDRITTAIDGLKWNPRPAGVKKLVGRSALRIRVGNYRVIYEIADAVLTVIGVEVEHRSDVCRYSYEIAPHGLRETPLAIVYHICSVEILRN